MTMRNSSPGTLQIKLLFRRAWQGALLALLLAFIFVLVFVGPGTWMIIPMATASIAGAIGGVIFHLLEPLRGQGRWTRPAINIAAGFIFLTGMWMGMVYGLYLVGLWD
jgi:hypothetical protein